MIPEGLKIGDTFTETSVDGKIFESKVIGFDGQGRYIAEFLGMVKPKEITTDNVITEEDVNSDPEEVTPIEQMLAEEKPEPKKAPARKPAARKRTTKKK